ncbi:ABC transporter permease [Limobrevibacterium gyesilva]|uniref:ABC transporter permease n=1 Tax=Limobrevibacterium gyesilva TaxID=2991712 RepID=A0AA42CFT0_9PROT|nr:ABC transporter permease [Limobrevibacterium gyesilva]MCW3475246.1 ABC transporter permease [Limobrevibacterium gyesilva]
MTTAAATAPVAPQTKPSTGLGFLMSLTLLGLLLAMWIALSLATDTFLTANNFANLMRQAALWAIIAMGQTFVIITAGIDLSVGAVIGFCSVIVAMLLQGGFPVWASVLITLGVGVAIGLFHGFGIVKMGLPPFIMTLATMTALRGIGLLMTNGATISITVDRFTDFSRGALLGVPNLFWMVILVAVPAFVLLHLSRWGRYIYAVGSNAEAARLSGVNVSVVIFLAYTVSAMLAAFAGILTAARIGVGVATTGDGWELQSIASSVIGGTSLFGAVGSVHGPLIGSFLLTTIANGANLLNINPFWQRIITGGLIIVIVYFDQMRRRRR